MSNDTQVQAHIEAVKAYARATYYGEHDEIDVALAAVEASARQLAEQPGFVMVPVEVVKFLTGEGPLDGLWFGENPFGLGGGKYWWRKHLFTARPLTASPTAPSTEQRPQNCGTGFCSCIECPFDARAQKGTP